MKRTLSTFRPHPGVDKKCPRCKGTGLLVTPSGEFAKAEVCPCAGSCPVCQDTSWAPTGPAFGAPTTRCACWTVRQRVRIFNEARIPARHAVCTLKSFDPSDPAVMPSFAEVDGYVRHFDPTGTNRGLVLHGDVGRGKTHLMTAILRDLVIHFGVACRFIEFSHLISDLKMAFERKEGAADLLEPLSRVQVLAIDELGKGRMTEFETYVLDNLVTRRYNASATILATTNYPPGPRTGRTATNLARPDELPHLVDLVGDRVYSRLVEMCKMVPLQGQDWRTRSSPFAP